MQVAKNIVLPTMKAATCSSIRANIEDVLTMRSDVPKPVLKPKSKDMLVRVLTCSLAPGDCRVMSGQCDKFQAPPTFPYIPGGDVCGIVEEIGDKVTKFRKGDCVVSRFADGPRGALAEYYVVKEGSSAVKPEWMSEEVGCALVASSLCGMVAAKKVQQGDRVLVLGGSGGVGSSIVQLARLNGASFVAATSTDGPLMQRLKVDRHIDYREENWWELDEFIKEPFDVVFDCVGSPGIVKTVNTTKAVKPGSKNGRYFTSMINDEPYFEIHSYGQAIKLMSSVLGRTFIGKFARSVPKYGYLFLLGTPEYDKLFKLIEEGKFEVVLDPKGPFPFTKEGVVEAFNLQKSRHAHGKVVVRVAHRDAPEEDKQDVKQGDKQDDSKEA